MEKDNATGSQPLRVTAYFKTSTNPLEPQNSYAAQKTYYIHRIALHSNWELAGVYADSRQHRAAADQTVFQQMLADCKAGKIDLILVRSIPQFCRNSADCLAILQMLKRRSIGVLFEKEQINMLNDSGDVLINISVILQSIFNLVIII